LVGHTCSRTDAHDFAIPRIELVRKLSYHAQLLSRVAPLKGEGGEREREERERERERKKIKRGRAQGELRQSQYAR
jgi:hypothetical protein